MSHVPPPPPPLLLPPAAASASLPPQVTCLACEQRSNTVEPFWDLSLEFPERYHSNSRETAAQASCHLTEMLAKFTETEALEGNIYACDHCNGEQKVAPAALGFIAKRVWRSPQLRRRASTRLYPFCLQLPAGGLRPSRSC